MQAAEQALGPGASVVARTLAAGETSDAAELQAARAAQAFAVARVAWEPRRASSSSSSTAGSTAPEPCCSEARIVVTVVSTRRRATQSLSFAPSDALTERGRAVGLVLAALTDPERATQIAETGGAAAPREVPAASPSAVTPSTAPSGDGGGSPTSREAPALTAVSAAAMTAPVTMRWALDAVGEQGFAFGGFGTGAGGAIGVRWVLSPRLAFRAGVRGRFGDVGAAQASSRALAASLGGVITLLPTRTDRVGASERAAKGGHFGLGLRVDALLLNESLSHLSTDDPSPVRTGRWMPRRGPVRRSDLVHHPRRGLAARCRSRAGLRDDRGFRTSGPGGDPGSAAARHWGGVAGTLLSPGRNRSA